jgi:hypothetical protein
MTCAQFRAPTGSRLVRGAAVEAVQRIPAHTRLGHVRDQVGARRGRNIAVVAAAREPPNWCSTACASTTSAAYPPPRPRREQLGPAVDADRAKS